MKKYWLHRITGGDNALEYAYPLLFTHNYLTIGWSVFSKDSFVEDVKNNGETAINAATEKVGWGRPKNRWNLWRFIKGMEKGDVVVVPTWSTFSLFEISDDVILSNQSMDTSIYKDWNGKNAILHEDGNYYNVEGKCIDLGFYRRVIPIELNIPREGYTDQDLYSRMKIRQTNADISDLVTSIINAHNSFKEKKPFNLKEQILEETVQKVLDLIENFTNDIKFEELVRWYLRSLGAKVDTPSKNESKTEDGDADAVGYFDNIKTAIMVQVKKHKKDSETDDWAVQQIRAFKANHNYGDYFTQMWVISSSRKFSDRAVRMAEDEGVRLIDGIEFAKMILGTGLEGLNL